jgi:ornithine decarboxylase
MLAAVSLDLSGDGAAPLEDYFASIHRAAESLPVSYSSELWCEPGRALSAEYNSMIVQVEKRRGNELFINEGAYGALYDAAHVDWRFPVKCLNAERDSAEEDFAFYGPTCDDADYMEGPFRLPADIKPGDYIEIGMLGAYGAAMRTRFNGFGAGLEVLVPTSRWRQYCGAAIRVSDNVVRLR